MPWLFNVGMVGVCVACRGPKDVRMSRSLSINWF